MSQTHKSRQLIDTYLKIREAGSADAAHLTTELVFIFDKFPEVKEYFRSRTDLFYRMSLGESE